MADPPPPFRREGCRYPSFCSICRHAAAEPCSGQARSTAPGFMIPTGSSAALIARIAASFTGSP